MKEGQELWDVIERIYEKNRSKARISPAWLATEGMRQIKFSRTLHELGYIGCHLQLRQIARSFCRKKFDPTVKVFEDDLFPETLQERYPLPRHAGEEPEYALLTDLTDDEAEFNIDRMRRAARALQKHADALEAWLRARRRAA